MYNYTKQQLMHVQYMYIIYSDLFRRWRSQRERERERERKTERLYIQIYKDIHCTHLVLDLDLDRLRERDFDFFLLDEDVSLTGAGGTSRTAAAVSTVVVTSCCCRRAKLASLTFLRASSTSLFVSEGEGPCGFTMAFLLWFTLRE